MEQFKIIDIGSEPCDLTTFKQKQEHKKNNLITNLKHCSETLHANSVEGLHTIVEDLKNVILNEGSYD
jgi:ribosomal 30S subunit maturation factor RimM